jgi:hypothetical protein
MADLVEAALAGDPERPTRGFDDREAPFVAMPDGDLRDRLVVEALRLGTATAALATTDESSTVGFAGRRLRSAELDLHGRSEAALHRWDLVGDDSISRSLLAAPELTTHAATVLNEMLAGSAESPTARAGRGGVEHARAVLRSPGRPDAILVIEQGQARFEISECDDCLPTVMTDPASRLLMMWGRHPAGAPVTWCEDPAARRELEALLWSVPTEG